MPPRQPDISAIAPWPGPPVGLLLGDATRVVPLVGAGVSVGAGLPTGPELAQWIRDHPLSADTDFDSLPRGLRSNLRHVSQRIVDSDDARREPLLEAVRTHIEELSDDVRSTPTLSHLAATPSGLVVTLNYDCLIERTAREAGRHAETLDLAQAMEFVSRGRRDPDVLRVVHLHGSVAAPRGSLVLEEREYARILSDERVGKLFSALVFDFNLLVLGTTLAEPHLLSALQSLRSNPPRHVLVCEQNVADSIAAGEASAPVTPSHGICVCSYSDGEHDVLEAFLGQLMSQRGPSHVTPPSPKPQDTLYVPRRFLRIDDVDDANLARLLGTAEIIDEHELARRPRTVVIGAAGAGKSTLCNRLPSGAPTAPVVISLRQVTEVLGSAEAVLTEWLPKAEPKVGIRVSDIVSGRQRAHLVLDGLDELVPRRREAAVTAINRLGEALPHIRITVSTRPAAAVASFAEGWQHFELLCDREWQQGFLSLAGTDLPALRARLGVTAPAFEPLLMIPFYLRRLATRGSVRVDAALGTGDETTVILALLDDLLTTDETLAPLSTGLRTWLTDCALLMQLSGVRQLGLGTLVTLARELDLGDVEELAQRLSARSLLQDSQDTWTFEHRLFAEALVADRITEDDPALWVDVLAPSIGDRSVVREDWFQIVRLIAARSVRWREALTCRDAVTVARVTPPDAPEAERVAAAWKLWEHSASRQVWIEGGFGGFDDAAQIARISPTPPPPDFLDTVETSLRHGSRYDRANAMDVLVRLTPHRAADLLAESLRNEPDSTVRRSSASWVRRLELAQLRELVIVRAERFDDEAEAADMASIALGLAPPTERLPIARRLRAAGNKEVRDHHALAGTPPGDQIKWMLDDARADPDEAELIGDSALVEALKQFTAPSAVEAADVAELALITGRPPAQSILAWVAEHPDGSAAGLVRALTDERGRYFVHRVARAIGSSALRRAGAPGPLIQQVEEAERFEETGASPPAETVHVPPNPRSTAPDESIADVLAKPMDDALSILARRERVHVVNVRRASGDTVVRFRDFIESLWGERDLRDEITHIAPDRVKLSRWVGVALAYGPACALPLTESRWVQVALCGWLFDPQHAWLRSTLTHDRLGAAVDEAPRRVRVITDLLLIAPPHLTHLVAPLSSELSNEELNASESARLLEALALARRVGELRGLAARTEALSASTSPLLARAGDTRAQREQLQRLRAALAAGNQIDAYDHPWLESIVADELLDDLVETYVACNNHPQSSAPFDVGRTVLAAIQRVGGRRSIKAVEDLADSRRWEGIQWLYRTVDEMVQQASIAVASQAAEKARDRLRLPPTDDPPSRPRAATVR